MAPTYCRRDQSILEAHSQRIAQEILSDIDHYFQHGSMSESKEASTQSDK